MPGEFVKKILQDNYLTVIDRLEIRGLVGAFISDMNGGRIDKQGNIKDPRDLKMIQVMYEPHRSRKTKTSQEEKKLLCHCTTNWEK